MLDVLIQGGHVFDGSGEPGRMADVGIVDGRIVELGRLAGVQARYTIQADGRAVAPGFIDMHSHDDFNLPVNPLAGEKTRQGVTTQVTGNCGKSPAPLLPETRDLSLGYFGFTDSGLNYDWHTLGEYMDRMPQLGLNVCQLVGHNTVRCAAMGIENRPPTEAELETMVRLVTEAMEAGAFGLSSGLMYVPGAYAATEEVVALTRVVARHGGGYYSHVRNMGLRVFEAVEEAIAIGREAGARVQVSHMKINHRKHWGRAAELMALVERSRLAGEAVWCDQYPYTAGSGGLVNSLPDWVLEGGRPAVLARLGDSGSRARVREAVVERMANQVYHLARWEDSVIASSPNRPDYVGLNLLQVAARENKEPVDAYLDLILADEGRTGHVHHFMNEADVRTIMQHSATAIGSDGIFRGVQGGRDPGQPHPRHFGTFPRILGHYTRAEKVLELPQAIHKMTALPATMLGLRDRGLVEPGYTADLVVFDPETVQDTATYEDPQQAPVGIDEVLVSGVPVVHRGEVTGATPGGVLRRQEVAA